MDHSQLIPPSSPSAFYGSGGDNDAARGSNADMLPRPDLNVRQSSESASSAIHVQPVAMSSGSASSVSLHVSGDSFVELSGGGDGSLNNGPQLTPSEQTSLLYKVEEVCLGAYLAPYAWLVRCCWTAPKRSNDFLAARGLQRISFRDLWRRRAERTHDVELAIEWYLAQQLVLFCASMILLLYSILQLLAQKAPSQVDNCWVGDYNPIPPSWVDYSAISGTENRFTAFWKTTNLAPGQGYRGIDGSFGVCVISASVTVTLSQSVLTQTLAWLVSWIGIIAYSFGYLLYFASGSVAMLLRCVRTGARLPSFIVTKRYYASNRLIVGILLFLAVSMILSMSIVVFFPSIFFRARGICPQPVGSAYAPQCWYNYASLKAQWSVFISELQICISCLLLVKTMSGLLSAIRDPFATLPPKAIMLDPHGSGGGGAESDQQSGKKDVELGASSPLSSSSSFSPAVLSALHAPPTRFSALSSNLLATLHQEDEYALHERADHARASFGVKLRHYLVGVPVSPTNRHMMQMRSPGGGVNVIAVGGAPAAPSVERVEWAESLLDNTVAGFEKSLEQEVCELQWKLAAARKALDADAPGQPPAEDTRYMRRLRVQLAATQQLQSGDVTVAGSAKAERFRAWRAPKYLRLSTLTERSSYHTFLAVIYRAGMTVLFSFFPLGIIWIGVLLTALYFTKP